MSLPSNARKLFRAVLVLAALAPAGIAQSKPRVITTALPNGTVGVAYSAVLDASGGQPPYTWTIVGGGLPPGLLLSALGTISGTPLAAGTFLFTVQVTDSTGQTATRGLQILVNPPLAVTTSSLPNGTVGVAYSQNLAAAGGSGGYTWSLTSGSLPVGLALSGSGAITGTPTTAAVSGFTVQVADSSGAAATALLGITVNLPALAVTTTSLPNGTVGAAYSQNLAASGGSGGYTWSLASGSLPGGLALSGTGAISGTPVAAGTSNFTVQVRDSSGSTTSATLSITVNAPPLAVTTTSLPNGTAGAAYSQNLAATGGSGGYTWSLASGSLPAGLTLSGSGTIAGTPTSAGTSNFTVQIRDSSGSTAGALLSITVNPPPLAVTTTSLPNGTVGALYSQHLTAIGGSGGYTWSLVSGSLPAGLALSGSGTIAGTPTTTGTSNFTVQARDSSGATATAPLSLTVAPPALVITTSTLPAGSVGAPYSQTLAATGGTPPYTWSIASGNLPAGLTLGGSGVISGTPSSGGSANFTVQVRDAASVTATRALSLTVLAPLVITTGTALPGGTVGIPYSVLLTVTGASGAVNWSITSGQLPAGLTLNAGSGIISGTPASAGNFAFSVHVTDAAGALGNAAFTLSVGVALTIITPTALANGSAGSPYTQILSASGGTPPYTWSLAAGALPMGLTLSAAGAIFGTPTQVGTFNISARVADANSASATAPFRLVVMSGLTIATPPALPGATVGVKYSVTLQPAGGTAPYVWVATSGSLPAGLTFHPAGTIDGTPTASGSFTVTVQVTDGNSNKATQTFTLQVAGALSITTASPLPPGNVGATYAQTLAASGGTAPYVWSVSGGGLPPGITLVAPTGALTGIPTSTGKFTFTVTVTDSASVQAPKQFDLTIGQGLTFTSPASLPGAMAGTAYSVTLGVTGGRAPYTWRITDGSLPGGLTLNATSGVIFGTPTANGTFNFTVQASDSTGLASSRVETIVVGLPAMPTITINGLPGNSGPLQQPLIDITVSSAYPVAITGRLSLAFSPAGANPVDDPSIQFSTGGRSAGFTIAANSTHATFDAPQLALQTGSVAGTISVTMESLQTGGTAVTVPAGVARTVQVDAGAPVIRSVAVNHISGGFEVAIVGVTTTRELAQATVRFTAAAGTSVQTPQATVQLGDAARAWFQGPDSAAYGGQFTLTIPFTVTGGTNALSSVAVVLGNGAGASPESSAQY
jgi:hypothetical protein